jgi:hypothetical protein
MSASGLDAFDATNAEDEHLDQGRYAGGGLADSGWVSAC